MIASWSERVLAPVLASVSFAAMLACGSSAGGYLETGNKLAAEGKYEDAVLNYKKAIQKQPQFAEAYYRMALAESKLDQAAEVFDHLNRAVELAPDHQPAREAFLDFLLTAFLASPAKPPEMYNRLDKMTADLLVRDPKSFEALRARAFLAVADRKPKLALELFEKAHQVKPFDPRIASAYAQLLLQNGEEAAGEKLARDAIAKDPANVELHQILYAFHRSKNRLADAEAILEQGLQKNPKAAVLYLLLSDHHRQAKDSIKADALLDKMLSNQPDFPRAYFQAGEYYSRRDPAKAREIFTAGASKDPGNATQYVILAARTWLSQGQPAEALKAASSAVASNPGNPHFRRFFGEMLLLDPSPGSAPQAVTHLEQAAKSLDDAETSALLGYALLTVDKPAAARTRLEEAIRKSPGHPAALLALAEAQIKLRDFKAAITSATNLLRIRPKDVKGRVLLATALIGNRQSQEARTVLVDLVSEFPNDPEALLQIGRLYIDDKRWAEAEQTFRKVQQSNPAEFRAVEGLSRVYLGQNQAEKAMAVWRELRTSPADAALVNVQLARTATAAGNGRLAKEIYEKLAAQKPDSVEYLTGLADAYRIMGDIRSAMQYYEKARAVSPATPYPAAVLAWLQQTSGDLPAAEASYRKAIELEPNNPHLTNNLAHLLATRKAAPEEALRLALQTVKSQPDNPEFLDTLAFVYLRQGNSAAALPIFSRLTQRHPKHPMFHYNLALAHLEQGDKEAARSAAAKALELEGSGPDAARIRDFARQLQN